MSKAIDVANYFLATLGSDSESDVTNLKLQKLCAYAQAVSLAFLGQPLFEEDLEAWTHGPVVPSVYRVFKKCEKEPIPPDGLSEKYAREPFSNEQRFVLELVKEWYGNISPWNLRDRSHMDFPGEFGSKRVIPKVDIAKRFADMPKICRLKEYTPPDSADERLLSEKEFWDAVSA